MVEDELAPIRLEVHRWLAPLGLTEDATPDDTIELTGQGRGIPVMRALIESVLIHYDNRGTEVFLRQPLPEKLLSSR